MQFTYQDPNTVISDFNSQPSVPPADPDEREPASYPRESVPTPQANSLPATELPMPSQPPSVWPLKFPHRPRKSDTPPNNVHPTLPIVVSWYWVIGSCVCLLAFLIYGKNSHN